MAWQIFHASFKSYRKNWKIIWINHFSFKACCVILLLSTVVLLGCNCETNLSLAVSSLIENLEMLPTVKFFFIENSWKGFFENVMKSTKHYGIMTVNHGLSKANFEAFNVIFVDDLEKMLSCFQKIIEKNSRDLRILSSDFLWLRQSWICSQSSLDTVSQ